MHPRSVAWASVVPLAALLLVALVAAGPLWGPGLLNTRGGGDSPFLLVRTHQLAANLRAGNFPVRWMPDAAYGLGYPFFNYYSALPYYLAAGLALASLDLLSAIKLTQTLFFAVAALGMYGWAQGVLRGRAGAWLAAVGYTLAPYHMVNVYARGDSLSEFAAFAFYPLVLWGLDHLAARPSLRRTVPPALAYAGLITAHNLSAFIFSPFALLYLIALMWHRDHQRWRVLAFGFLALSFGFSLSAWYWLPALAEIEYGQLTAQTTGYFFYGNHFRGADLVQPGLVFDYASTSSGPASFAAMGLAQAVLALAGALVVAAGRGTGSGARAFALAGLALSTFLITPLSRPLWDCLPLLPVVQFPWRFLSVQALFTALLSGALAASLRRWGWGVAVLVAGVLAVTGLAGLRPEYLPIAAEEVTVERLQLYELFSGNIGSTIRYEYLPRWVVPRPHTGPALFDPGAPPRAIPLSGDLARTEEVAHEPTRRVWTVEASAGGAEVAFPLHYWPGWRAAVDGVSTEVSPSPDSGYLALNVPAGQHQVEMWLGHTPLRAVAEGISVAAVLALLAIVVISRRGIPDPKSIVRSLATDHWPLVIGYWSFAILLALLVALGPRVPPSGESDLTMDFGQMPYLHHNPGGVDYDGWQLTGYHYSSDRLAPGGTLRVTLGWEAWQEGAKATLCLVSPAAVRHGELSAIAEAAAPATVGTDNASLDLPIPHDLGPGMYLVRLEDEDQRAAYLRPVWVDAGRKLAEGPAGAVFAGGALRLHQVETAQIAPDRLDLRLGWSAARPVAANYGLSLRLTDPAGSEWARLDTQPGYGFLPTSLWPAGRLVHDRYTLALPAGTPPGDRYTLAVILYRVATRESVGEYALPVSLHRATTRPDASVVARFGQEVALSRLEVPERVRQGETLDLTAYWLSVGQPSTGYVAEWRLEAAAQTISVTLPLAPGSSPVTWPVGAWVVGRAALPIPPTVPPGDYTLSLTLHDPGDGASLGTYTHPQAVRVQERERVWELPPMQQEVGARFGGMIELAGYDLEREGDTLRLTFHWVALAVPDQHYMLFVHLADPATGRPVAQVDTMPRGFTYPTGIWAPGEVVSDEVGLSLEGVPTGRYDLAVGWYEAETGQRLSAADRAGSALSGDRLILPESITLP